ncbi:hypothetical protein [Paenibacillus brasilensis]|uniref:Phage protein n=1 Tax=Paenibacillus brasilensis TaxID=128574 RepID=A0ABU0KTK1_9BACL|nr:hypothetical protein [Paenibacillus brasilensis]MDQ0492754.1 hypothetical protein [Paenibacillus brasilensis]
MKLYTDGTIEGTPQEVAQYKGLTTHSITIKTADIKCDAKKIIEGIAKELSEALSNISAVETGDLTREALRKLGIRDFKINFNEYVKVKLTETGLKILREQCNELNSYIGQRGGSKVFGIHNKTDDEGYTRFQIWDLINTFGTHLTMGLPEPFESTMIFLNGEAIGPVGKPPDSPQ